MRHGFIRFFLFWLLVPVAIGSADVLPDTLPALKDGRAPDNFQQMWAGFDPRREPLEVETLRQWEEDGVVLRVVRFRIGVFKGKKARLAGIYGYPKSAAGGGSKLPGLLQIHGGGQYADHRACMANAKRGYATLSIAWAGRISAPGYRVTPKEVRLFWENRTDDPDYRMTTDWGAVDGYHAPGRNPGNAFPSARAADWTLDRVESPRNSGWFLCALAARRALTFLEQQLEVDPNRLGVYGHSMGGKLTVMTAVDPRVKAAAPSCGGISDRDNRSPLFRATLGDDVSLRKVTCPIIFLSPANDFHGRIGDLPDAVSEIGTDAWRVTCSPHLNHRDHPPYEVATLLWFDEHLRSSFVFPRTPAVTLTLATPDNVPVITIEPDGSRPVRSVDVYYTRQGSEDERPEDRENTKHRFWHHAKADPVDGVWKARLPLSDVDRPLWIYANVSYPLDAAVTGAGYYYGSYTARSFNVSSLLKKVIPERLREEGVRATAKPTLLIEDFEGDWQKQWFTYKPDDWARSTHKVHDNRWKAPPGAALALDVRAEQSNGLVVVVDGYAAVIQLKKPGRWETVRLAPGDLRNADGRAMSDWTGIRQLKLCAADRLDRNKVVGGRWKGPAPSFRRLRWEPANARP